MRVHRSADDPTRLVNAILRADLGTFIPMAFKAIFPGETFLPNWHIDAIAHALARVHAGECRRLIITQPPRSLKSICASVAFPAWLLGHRPGTRIACVSYSQELTNTFARQFRNVLKSDRYRRAFPGLRLEKDTESEVVTTKRGGRLAVPVGGSFTGRGADLIVIDDPTKAEDAHSEIARRAVAEWFSRTALSRLDNKKSGSIVLVSQRLHEDDLAGSLLREGGWEHLDLPAIALDDEVIPIGPGAVHRRRKGEALHVEREPLDALEGIRREMGSLTFSAQYLQRPVPVEGNLIKREWLQWFDDVPSGNGLIGPYQSWDVASTASDQGDYSVCTTWVKIKRHYYLIDLWRGRLAFPALKKKLIELAHRHNPNAILIERDGLGLPLFQEFQTSSIPGVRTPIGINAKTTKLVRMEGQSARFEAGQVHLPREAPWLPDLLHELLAFPRAKNDDQIDSIAQFLSWIETRATISYEGMHGPIMIRA